MKNKNNRGMLLESIINNTNEYYFKNGIALIHKKNLDIKFKNVKLEKHKLLLNNASIFSKSTVDYYGVWKGRFLAFEVKSTEQKNFEKKNIKKHQIEYLNKVVLHQGIAFWIIYFKFQNEFLLIEHANFKKCLFEEKKSYIFFETIKSLGKEIKLIFPGILDFLNILK